MNPERAAQITDEIEFLRSIAARLKTFGMRHNDEITPMAALFSWFADCCQYAFDQGVDWAYEPERLQVAVFETRYLGEKWSRVFGRFLGSHRDKTERQMHVDMFFQSAKWLISEPEPSVPESEARALVQIWREKAWKLRSESGDQGHAGANAFEASADMLEELVS